MKKEKAPAYQWYPKDILTDLEVAQLSLSEEGAYRRALDFCWLNNGLPNDAKAVAKIIGKGCTPSLARVVMAFFVLVDGPPSKLVNKKQEKIREDRAEWLDKCAKGGRNKNKVAPENNQVNGKKTSSKVEVNTQVNDKQTATLHPSSSSSSSKEKEYIENESSEPEKIPKNKLSVGPDIFNGTAFEYLTTKHRLKYEAEAMKHKRVDEESFKIKFNDVYDGPGFKDERNVLFAMASIFKELEGLIVKENNTSRYRKFNG